MRVNEIFYSLQGEGARAGEPSVFVRLSDCNLTCNFCDTEFESGREMSDDELVAEIKRLGGVCRWIVWTGGEPTMQLTEPILHRLSAAGYHHAIETNGSRPLGDAGKWIEHVTVSPKVAEHVVAKNFPDGVTELRYVRGPGQQGIPQPKTSARFFYLSPMFRGDVLDRESLAHCIELCLANPAWRLSVQNHKMWKVR